MRKIIYTFIAAVLLVSTTGMTINLHYCYGHLYDVGLYEPAESCCDNRSQNHHCHSGLSAETPDHCQDDSIVIKITDDYLAGSYQSVIPVDPEKDSFFTAHPAFNLNFFYTNYHLVSSREYHFPPLSQKTFLSQIQSYRL